MMTKEWLQKGNEAYVAGGKYAGDVSASAREHCVGGQSPKAVVLTCSDFFSAGIGELFVIRVAGNVACDATLGSIEYATGHLGTRFVLVLGHTGCGAINAALFHESTGYVRAITDTIREAIGGTKDEKEACMRNVRRVVEEIGKCDLPQGTVIAGGVYDLKTGVVTFTEGA